MAVAIAIGTTVRSTAEMFPMAIPPCKIGMVAINPPSRNAIRQRRTALDCKIRQARIAMQDLNSNANSKNARKQARIDQLWTVKRAPMGISLLMLVVAMGALVQDGVKSTLLVGGFADFEGRHC